MSHTLPTGRPLGLQPLSEAPRPLVDLYDTGLFDLDGVVYIGAHAVPGAPAALDQARSRGMRVMFLTNNASRTPEAVAAHLTGVGVPATAEDVVTAAQAAAGLVAERVPPGARVLVVGGDGLVAALRERGLVPVFSASERPSAVVQGFHPDVGWRQLAEGAYAVAAGIPWVASNVDVTLPTDGGLAPGNGALVEVIRLATGRDPVVAGKPGPTLFTEALTRTGGRRPLVVGDRLDTDVEGAHAAGLPSLLVLTGVTRLRDLLTAPPARRPTYIAADLGGMFVAHPRPVVRPGHASCGGWAVDVRPGHDGARRAVLTGEGDPLDGARALLAAVWSVPQPVDADEALERLRRGGAAVG